MLNSRPQPGCEGQTISKCVGFDGAVLLCQGRAVGSAAHLTALRRESIGAHNVADAWTVPDLVAAAQAAREA